MTNRQLISLLVVLSTLGWGSVGSRPALSQTVALEQLEEAAIRSAVERITPSVVRIDLIGGGTTAGDLEAVGPTSGVIITTSGDVLTSSFAFSTSPASILVTTDDGQQHPAKFIAADHSRQLVLLRIEGVSDLQPAEIVSRDTFAVGQWTIAVGRGLAADQPSVSVGIVSALSRIRGRAVQTDASISPINYGGPLVDISGRVIGILTPLAPDNGMGASGTDWYDSGIGFAVPLAEYGTSLARLQSGEDLHPGLVGIAFASGNPLATPPVIASVRPRSPASQADLRASDRIVALNGVRTETQAALQRQLGQLYAGDAVTFTIGRGQSTLDARVTLARELEPFRHASLGIRSRSRRADDPTGVEVAQLLPGGPAREAGLHPGDRILQVGEREIEDVDQLAEAVRARAPGDDLLLQVRRAGNLREISVTLSERSAELFPHQHGEPSDGDPAGELQEFKLPEFAAPCPLYQSANRTDEVPWGLLLVLQADKNAIDAETLRQWQIAAEQNQLILALPGPQEERGWSRRDIEYLRQLIRTLIERHSVDRRRVALVGADVPNNASLSLWLANREFVRGVWFNSADLPGRIELPENEPNLPCLFLATTDAPNRTTVQFLERWGERGFAAAISPDSSPAAVAAWADSLDRL